MAGSLRHRIGLLARIALGAVFVYAGAVKIWDFAQHTWSTQAFYEDVLNYHLLPEQFASDAAMLIAVYLPWVEVVAGTALLFRRWVAGASALLGGLSVVFIGAIASAWARGLDINCGCFGRELNSTNYPLHLVLNLALLGAAVAAFWGDDYRKPTLGPP